MLNTENIIEVEFMKQLQVWDTLLLRSHATNNNRTTESDLGKYSILRQNLHLNSPRIQRSWLKYTMSITIVICILPMISLQTWYQTNQPILLRLKTLLYLQFCSSLQLWYNLTPASMIQPPVLVLKTTC